MSVCSRSQLYWHRLVHQIRNQLETESEQQFGDFLFNNAPFVQASKRGEVTTKECYGRTFVVYSLEEEEQEPSY
jgi:hypothetical protein